MKTSLWVSLQKNGCPWPSTLHVRPQRRSPAPPPRPSLCVMLFVGLHIFAHVKNSSGRVCTCITSQYSVLTEEGIWESFSTSGELQSGGPRTRASGGRGDLANTTGACGYEVSRDTCVLVFKSACLTSQSNPSGFVVLLRLAVFSSVFLPFYHIYFHDYYARVVLKLKVSCLISSYY